MPDPVMPSAAERECPDCRGVGYLDMDEPWERQCAKCEGRGVITRRRLRELAREWARAAWRQEHR